MGFPVGITLLAALAGAPALDGSVLVLKDGRIFEGIDARVSEGGYTVTFENGVVEVPTHLVMDAILEHEQPYEPKTDEEREKLERGLVPFDGEWIKASLRDRNRQRLLDEKRAEIESMREHSEWRNRLEMKTKNFSFESTAPAHLLDHYSGLLEAYFQDFSKAWKIRKPRDVGRVRVCFYVDRDLYQQVTGAPPGANAHYVFVQPYSLHFFYDALNPGSTEDVMFHEASHYLQHLIDLDFLYPKFPGESLAEYYGASSWDPKTGDIVSGLIQEGRLTEIQQDIAEGNRVGIEELIQSQSYLAYTWGWSLVHFLMSNPDHRKRFQSFYMGLAKDKKVERTKTWFSGVVANRNFDTVTPPEMLDAFKRFMALKKPEDLLDLEADWHDYIENDLEVTSSIGLEDAAYNAYRNNRKLRAKRLFGEALALGRTRSITHQRYGELLEDLEEYDAAIEQFELAIEKAPLSAGYYISLGRFRILRKKDVEEGKRLLRLAGEIDPDDIWIRSYLTGFLKRR